MKYVLIITAVLLAGCTTKKVEQTDTLKAGLKSQADIVEPAPLVNGNNNVITLPEGYDPTTKRKFSNSSQADMSSEYSYSVQMSVGLNIFLLGIGIYLLYTIGKKSKVIRLTGAILDNAGASAIAMASSATDPKDIASANHFRAEIEGARRHL